MRLLFSIRYRNLDSNFFKPHQMKRYYEGGSPESLEEMVKMSEQRTLNYGQSPSSASFWAHTEIWRCNLMYNVCHLDICLPQDENMSDELHVMVSCCVLCPVV